MLIEWRTGTLKLARGKVNTVNGIATILLKIPGNSMEDSRIINGGEGWFTVPHDDDYVEVYVTDEDNLLGYGAGAVVGSYTDTDVSPANKGWFLPKSAPTLRINALAGLGVLKGGLYLKIIATKGDLSLDTFRCNIEWGIIE